MPRSKAEECLAAALEADALPGWDLVREYRLDASRRWSLDFAWPSQRLAIEVDGRYHRTPRGQNNDSIKRNEAIRQGWRILTCPADRMSPPRARELVRLVWELLCCPPSSGLDSDE